ncbi:haloacid dehalogenase type II [Vibrio hannami]|uniref:haloacid dehalogenase type II n=1 Tax=Vibrio hannami TaxID=2717094 RepID=UPI00240F0094|nr:haloacid dehalogenase type II [Vibrio hannami]MDG3085084.1 haloacid dehalogenase type II [Vibrio hannami]
MALDTILFDINETVLNLDSLKSKFKDAFGDEKVASIWFSTLLHSSTVCVVTGVETNFAELAKIALKDVASRLGVNLSDEKSQNILGSFANLQPHCDIIGALSKLRTAGYKTVAFSNSSQRLITSQINNAGLVDYFDEIVSVEATGSFKPDPRVYEYVAKKLGQPKEQLRLVATHDWDIHGALSVGLKAAYIDRLNSPYNPLYIQPDIKADSMHDIVDEIIKLGKMY